MFGSGPRQSMATILCIDDDRRILETNRALLSQKGHTVLIASDGTTGIALARQHGLDLALVALLVCRALNPPMGDYAPYVLAASAIAFSAWYCGVGPSLSAIILAAIGVKYWFVPPIHMLRIQNSGQWIDLLGFLFFSSVVV